MEKIIITNVELKKLCEDKKVATSASFFSSQKAYNMLMECDIIFTTNIVAYNFFKQQDNYKDIRYCDGGKAVLDSMNNREVGYSDLSEIVGHSLNFEDDVYYEPKYTLDSVTQIYSPCFSEIEVA